MPDFRECESIDDGTPTKNRKPSLAMDGETAADLLEKVFEIVLDLGLTNRHRVAEVAKEGVGGLIVPSDSICSKLGDKVGIRLAGERKGYSLG
ncbi:hypothetical protein BGX28_002061 [Mortierella sp. GBA30]|nr:hypothetical protein BGX28_002061 [Mortierella sp. GBA30]